MKVASAAPDTRVADGAGHVDGEGGGGWEGRRGQQLLKPGTLRSSSSSSSVDKDNDGAAAVSSPLALSLLGRLVGRLHSLFANPPGWLPMVVLLHNQFIFAGMHVIAKPALHHIPPFALALMRISLAVPFLFLIAWKEGSLPKLTKCRELPYLCLLALVGVALPQTLIFVANQLAGPSIIAILSPAAPVYAAIFAAVLRLERLTLVKVGGIFLAISGAFVVLRPDQMHFGGQPTDMTAGIFVMIVQTMMYASFLIALKIRLQTRPYPFGIYAYASLIGVVMIALFSFFHPALARFDAAAVPPEAWGAVVYCGIVVSFWAHACNAWAVSKTSASIPALFSCLSPFLTGFLAYLVLGTTMGSASDIIGLALNVTGLLAVIYSKLRLETPSAQGGGGGSGGAAAGGSVCQVQPMPAEAAEEENDEQEAEHAAAVAATAAAGNMMPTFVPTRLTSVPEELEGAASAPPSPMAAAARVS